MYTPTMITMAGFAATTPFSWAWAAFPAHREMFKMGLALGGFCLIGWLPCVIALSSLPHWWQRLLLPWRLLVVFAVLVGVQTLSGRYLGMLVWGILGLVNIGIAIWLTWRACRPPQPKKR